MYVKEETKPEMRLVEMFHAGTPQTVKYHITTEMIKHSSHLRVLICTVAFGMRIDCKDVYRSVHFGPSKTVETLIQECGRLGRYGKACNCYILYNRSLTAHCHEQMKKLIHSKDSCTVNRYQNYLLTQTVIFMLMIVPLNLILMRIISVIF